MLISGAGGETKDGNPAGYIVLIWQPSNPKRLGYQLKFIDTETNIIDESLTGAKQEQEEHTLADEVIQRTKVEAGFFIKLWNLVKSWL